VKLDGWGARGGGALVVAVAKMGQGGGRASLRGRTSLLETISSGRWRGRTPLRDSASWLGTGAPSLSLGAGTTKARQRILVVGGFGRRGCSPLEMARSGGAELGKAIPTPWHTTSACLWSISNTGAASPDNDGVDWRRQWSPDGYGGGGDACPNGGSGGGDAATTMFVATQE
jgi:hypothetical protein